MGHFGKQEEWAIKAFSQPYKEYVDAYNETLTDLQTHGTLLREFIWKRDSASKLKLQMIDAVVKGDIERVKEKERILNSLISKALGGSYNFFFLRPPVPDWTFNPSLLEVYVATPATTGETPSPILTSPQNMAIIEAKIEISQAQSLPEEQRSTVMQSAENKIESAIASGGTISEEEELTPEMIDAYDTYKSSQPTTLSAGFSTLSWLLIGGTAISAIASSLFRKKRRGK